MKSRCFFISGFRPAYGKQVNDLVKMFDLGIEGVFTPFSHDATILIKDDVTDEQWAEQPSGIKRAYEEVGCAEVGVMENTPEYRNTAAVIRGGDKSGE